MGAGSLLLHYLYFRLSNQLMERLEKQKEMRNENDGSQWKEVEEEEDDEDGYRKGLRIEEKG